MKVLMMKISVTLALFATLFAFQNCTTKYRTIGPVAQGNGDSYSGMIAHYLSQDPTNPCNKLSNLGNPFPKTEIFLNGSTYQLVRQNCMDITPIPLDPTAITIDNSNNTVVYQGQTLSVQTDLSEYNQVPVVCPAGTSPNMTTGNQLADPLNLMTSPPWFMHPGVSVTLAGSVLALPIYQVQLTNPSELEDWRRVYQNIPLTPNTPYVLTFLMQRNNDNDGVIEYYFSDTDLFDIDVNFATQTTTVAAALGLTPVVTNVSAYGSALAVSVAFTTPAEVTGITGGFGVNPYRPGNATPTVDLGDAVNATAASLYICQ